jgi:hypothetical protein
VCDWAAFEGRVWEADAIQETNEGKIDLPEDEPAIIKLLMQYLYKGNYVIESSGISGFRVVKAKSYKRGHVLIHHTYDFPHTCTVDGFDFACDANLVCPHNLCGKHCDYNYICTVPEVKSPLRSSRTPKCTKSETNTEYTVSKSSVARRSWTTANQSGKRRDLPLRPSTLSR